MTIRYDDNGWTSDDLLLPPTWTLSHCCTGHLSIVVVKIYVPIKSTLTPYKGISDLYHEQISMTSIISIIASQFCDKSYYANHTKNSQKHFLSEFTTYILIEKLINYNIFDLRMLSLILK
jgi:hypothetical protein